MASQREQDLTTSTTLPIPTAYRVYLLKNYFAGYLASFLFGVMLLIDAHALLHLHSRLDVTLLWYCLITLFSGIYRGVESWRQSSHFMINRKGMTTVWWRQFNIHWSWHRLIWFTEAVIGVESCEWRGLPALHILAGEKRKINLLIVFREEDRTTVETQIRPLIELYRRRYRTQVLTELLQR